MFDIVAEVAQVDDITLDKLLKAVRHRYSVLFPDWEVITISLQKTADPNEQLDQMIHLLQQMKTPSSQSDRVHPQQHNT